MDTTRVSLILRVKDPADQSAWREFDLIYRPMMIRFARARGLSESDADEISQECMAAVHEHIRRFEYDPDRGRFKGWLRTLVNNRIRNRLRDRHEFQADSVAFAEVRDDDPGPDALFDQVWQQEHLRHCLATVRGEVDTKTFDAFVAHVIEDAPVDDVCARFGLTANQVYLAKSRMLRRIRERMMELLGEDSA
ncbi:MAG: sigma-70 family RNA polymerase sigma factor [Phycisphaerae bacterium]|nr:sigma-70 family RNA polymerase sigma factor [Phycisphaerae bacterium]